MRTEHLILKGERPKSWNAYWSGVHWSKRKQEADRVHMIVRFAIDPDVLPFDVPVHITVTTYFKGKMLDANNICCKPYVDGLIGWLIEDDSPEYVPMVSLISKKDNSNPRMEILITPA